MASFFSAAGDIACSRRSWHRVGQTLFGWILPALVAWTPAIFTAAMVEQFAVDIPVWDDFERVPLIEKFEKGELAPSYLVSPHIEHRILIPRLIILANHAWGGGDLRNEVWVIFFSMVISSACIAWLIFKTVGRSTLGWLLILLANLSIFTLIQYQNLCWAIQTGMLLPQMFLCLTLVALHSSMGITRKFVLALLGSVAASFCFTHGLVVWAVGLAYLLLGAGPEKLKARLSVALVWLVLMGGFFSFYFHNLSSTSSPAHSYFQQPGETPPGLGGLLAGESDPDKVGEFGLKVLGSQFSRFAIHPPRYLAEVVGAIKAISFAVLAGVGVFLVGRLRWRDSGDESARAWRSLLPWMALGAYVMATVLIMSLGRSHISVNRAMAPRYVSITLYLTVAILVLGPLVFRLLASDRPRLINGLAPFGFVLAGAFISVQCWNQAYGYRSLQIWHSARWQSLVVIAFPDFLPPRFEKRLDLQAIEARDYVARLKAFGGFDKLPDPIGPEDFDRFKVSSKTLSEKRAGIVGVEEQSNGWELTGFADTRSFMGRIPDGILFTSADPATGDRVIVGFAESVAVMPFYVNDWDFEFEFISPQTLKTQTQWVGKIARDHLPEMSKPPIRIEAWAIDFERNRLHRLKSSANLSWNIPAPAGLVVE